MKPKILLVALLVSAVLMVAIKVQANPSSSSSNLQWLQKVVAEGRGIVPGSSQAELLKLYTPDAGDQPSPYRYLLKNCQLISIEVTLGPAVKTVSSMYLSFPTRPKPYSAQEEWLIALMKDCTAIKPGMKRVELLKNFEAEAGLQAMMPTRYVHKKAPLVKIDAGFEAVDKGKEKAGPVIKSVSRPYVDLAICD